MKVITIILILAFSLQAKSQSRGYLLVNANGTYTLPTGGAGSFVDSTTYATKYRLDTTRNRVNTDLSGKQATLVSATNIKTINGSSVLGSGDLVVSGAAAWGSVTGTLSNQTDLQTALDSKLSTATAAATYQPIGSYTTNSGSQILSNKTIEAFNYAADAGSNDSYVIALSPVPAQYTTGMVIFFKANTVNTGAASLNVNGLGAKTIVKRVSTALANGDIPALALCMVIYNGTNFVLLNPVVN